MQSRLDPQGLGRFLRGKCLTYGKSELILSVWVTRTSPQSLLRCHSITNSTAQSTESMRRNNRSLLVIGLTCAFFILLLSSFVYGQQGATLRASYIDVGQGDSILLHARETR